MADTTASSPAKITGATGATLAKRQPWILIPYDLDPGAKDPNRAIVPVWFWRQLETPPRAAPWPVLLTKAEYQGEVIEETRVLWQARMWVHLDARAPMPAAISLRFAGIQMLPRGFKINGKSSHFVPPSEKSGLDFSLSEPGEHQVDLEFTTPLLSAWAERELSFAIPQTNDTLVNLRLGTQPCQLSPQSEPRACGIRIEANQFVLGGRLGPTERLRLRWRHDAPNTNTARVQVESARLLQLDDQTYTQNLVAVFRYPASDSPRTQFVFALGAGLVIRRVEVPGLMDWTLEENSSKGPRSQRRLSIFLDSPRMGSNDVVIVCSVPVGPNFELELPEVQPLDAQQENGVIGVLLPDGWTVSNDQSRNAERDTAAHFRGVWQQWGRTLPERANLLARRFSRRLSEGERQAVRWVVWARADSPQWSVDQDVLVRLTPNDGMVEVTASVNVRVTSGAIHEISAHLPRELQLRRVQGENLYQWFDERPRVVVRADRPQRAGWNFTVTGTAVAKRLLPESRNQLSFPLAALEWQGAQQVITTWRVQAPDRWRLSARNTVGIDLDPTLPSPLTLKSRETRHAFQVIAEPIPPSAQIDAITLAQTRDNHMELRGRLEFRFDRPLETALTLVTPADWGLVHWRAGLLRLVHDRVEGKQRLWTFEPHPMNKEPVIVDWQAPRVGNKLVISPVTAPGYSFTEQWLVFASDERGKLRASNWIGLDAISLESKRFPISWRTWIKTNTRPTNGVSTPIAQEPSQNPVQDPGNGQADRAQNTMETQVDRAPHQNAEIKTGESYRANSASWSARLQCDFPAENTTWPVNATDADVDMVLTPAGTCWGVQRWSIEPGFSRHLILTLPDGCAMLDLDCDGQPLLPRALEANQWELPLPRRANKQTLSVLWRMEKVGRDWIIPQCAELATTTLPTTLRIRSPWRSSIRIAATEIDRSVWRQPRAPNGLATASRWSAESAGAVPAFSQLLANIPAREERFFRADRMPDIVTIEVESPWRQWFPHRSQAVRLLALVLLLLAYWSPRVENWIRPHWPSLLLAFGIAWCRWSTPTWFGVVLVTFSVLGSIWLIVLWWLPVALPAEPRREGESVP